jgi:hypothetical protein
LRAKRSAPLPASKTWRLFSITARAASIGLRMRHTAATAPARSVAPSIGRHRSPSVLNDEPRPALKSGSPRAHDRGGRRVRLIDI